MLLIGNGTVVTRDAARPLISGGAVAVEGNRILKVGSCEALRAQYRTRNSSMPAAGSSCPA